MNTSDTYTFTFHTQYVDLVKWRMGRLPGVGELDLHRFWDDASIAFVLYEGGGGDGGHCHAVDQRKEYLNFVIEEAKDEGLA